MAVRVVNAYCATSDLVLVTFERNVDFPTEGKPTRAIRASPLLLTSKPEPPPPPAPGPGSRSCALSRASFLGDVSERRLLHQPTGQLTLLVDPNGILHASHYQHSNGIAEIFANVPVALFSTSLVSILKQDLITCCQKLTLRPPHLIFNPKSRSVAAGGRKVRNHTP